VSFVAFCICAILKNEVDLSKGKGKGKGEDKIKVKVKCTLEQAVKTQREIRGINLLFL